MVRELFFAWKQADVAAKDAVKKAEAAKQALLEALPVGKELEGVRHTTYTRKTVKYSDIVIAIRARLLSAEMQEEADKITEEFTNETVIDKFEEVNNV